MDILILFIIYRKNLNNGMKISNFLSSGIES